MATKPVAAKPQGEGPNKVLERVKAAILSSSPQDAASSLTALRVHTAKLSPIIGTLCTSFGLIPLLLQALGLQVDGQVHAPLEVCSPAAELCCDLACSSSAPPHRAALLPLLPALVGLVQRHPSLSAVAGKALAAMPVPAWKLIDHHLASHWQPKEVVVCPPAGGGGSGAWALHLLAPPPAPSASPPPPTPPPFRLSLEHLELVHALPHSLQGSSSSSSSGSGGEAAAYTPYALALGLGTPKDTCLTFRGSAPREAFLHALLLAAPAAACTLGDWRNPLPHFVMPHTGWGSSREPYFGKPVAAAQLAEWRARHPYAPCANLAHREGVSDSELALLAGVRALALDGCAGAPFTDAGLAQLAGSLRYLSLTFCSQSGVGDEGLAALGRGGLQWLDISGASGAGFSRAGVAALRERGVTVVAEGCVLPEVAGGGSAAGSPPQQQQQQQQKQQQPAQQPPPPPQPTPSAAAEEEASDGHKYIDLCLCILALPSTPGALRPLLAELPVAVREYAVAAAQEMESSGSPSLGIERMLVAGVNGAGAGAGTGAGAAAAGFSQAAECLRESGVFEGQLPAAATGAGLAPALARVCQLPWGAAGGGSGSSGSLRVLLAVVGEEGELGSSGGSSSSALQAQLSACAAAGIHTALLHCSPQAPGKEAALAALLAAATSATPSAAAPRLHPAAALQWHSSVSSPAALAAAALSAVHAALAAYALGAGLAPPALPDLEGVQLVSAAAAAAAAAPSSTASQLQATGTAAATPTTTSTSSAELAVRLAVIQRLGAPPKPASISTSKTRRLALLQQEEAKARRAGALRTCSLALASWSGSKGGGGGSAAAGASAAMTVGMAVALVQSQFRRRKAARERAKYESSAVVQAAAKFSRAEGAAAAAAVNNSRDGAGGKLLKVGWVRVEGGAATEGQHYYVNALLGESTWVAPLEFERE